MIRKSLENFAKCKVEVKIRLWRNEEQIGGEETEKV